MFRKAAADWVRYRYLPNLLEIDFHTSDSRQKRTACRTTPGWMPFGSMLSTPSRKYSTKAINTSNSPMVGLHPAWATNLSFYTLRCIIKNGCLTMGTTLSPMPSLSVPAVIVSCIAAFLYPKTTVKQQRNYSF